MMERKCNECAHKKEKGCEKWSCEFEPKYADPTEDAGTLAEQKNIHCGFTAEEIAKDFIENVKAVEDLLPRKMKYVAIIESDDGLSEDAIKNLVKNTTFIDCGETPYCFEITSIKQAPEEEPVLVPCEYRENDYAEGYNQALRDCGVLEE